MKGVQRTTVLWWGVGQSPARARKPRPATPPGWHLRRPSHHHRAAPGPAARPVGGRSRRRARRRPARTARRRVRRQLLRQAAHPGRHHPPPGRQRRRGNAALARLPVRQHQRVRPAQQPPSSVLRHPAVLHRHAGQRAQRGQLRALRPAADHAQLPPAGSHSAERVRQQVQPLVGQQPAEAEQAQRAAMRHRRSAGRRRSPAATARAQHAPAGAPRQLVRDVPAQRHQRPGPAQQRALQHRLHRQDVARVQRRVVHRDGVGHPRPAQRRRHQQVQRRRHGAHRAVQPQRPQPPGQGRRLQRDAQQPPRPAGQPGIGRHRQVALRQPARHDLRVRATATA